MSSGWARLMVGCAILRCAMHLQAEASTSMRAGGTPIPIGCDETTTNLGVLVNVCADHCHWFGLGYGCAAGTCRCRCDHPVTQTACGDACGPACTVTDGKTGTCGGRYCVCNGTSSLPQPPPAAVLPPSLIPPLPCNNEGCINGCAYACNSNGLDWGCVRNKCTCNCDRLTVTLPANDTCAAACVQTDGPLSAGKCKRPYCRCAGVLGKGSVHARAWAS